VEADHPDRIIVCASTDAIAAYKSVLNRTRRLPKSVEWREVNDRNLVRLIGGAAVTSNVVLLLGDRCYHPKLLRRAMAWRDSRCLAFGSGDDLVGICVLPQEKAAEIGNSALNITSLKRLHDWLQRLLWVETASVPNDYFQRISVPLDTCEAERKLEGWLIKPTDGIFARANRRISIPISRKLIKLPISANMVSLFVLSISLLCGYCYARGGYWSALVAALLGAAASVLDGCDGEVARFKLQSTAFGCWLDTICDYIWYAVAFAGMGIGLARTSGSHTYYNWGAALLFGTGMTFIVVSIMRRRITNAHPENMLAIWQEKAESRSSNPLLYLGRNTEFILRRCFLPYLLLFFAVFGLTNVIFVLAALGANIAWLIALYSHLDFSQPSTPERAEIGGRMAKPRSA
jgi:phosphatidylglycerophosphate synthase